MSSNPTPRRKPSPSQHKCQQRIDTRPECVRPCCLALHYDCSKATITDMRRDGMPALPPLRRGKPFARKDQKTLRRRAIWRYSIPVCDKWLIERQTLLLLSPNRHRSPIAAKTA